MAENALSITAPQSWWASRIKNLMLSSDKSSATNSTFLSCVFFDANSERLTLKSQSSISSTGIMIDGSEEVSYEGAGKFLIRCSDISSLVSQMPSDDDVTIIIDSESTVTVTNNRDISFKTETYPLIDESLVPESHVDFPDGSEVISCSPAEFARAYASGSCMTKPSESDPLAGQHPLSGARVTIGSDGIQVFSAFTSSSESFVKCDNNISEEYTCLTEPSNTLVRVNSMDYGQDISMCIDTSGNLNIRSGDTFMSIKSLNTGSHTSSIGIDNILSVLNPVWGARSATISLSSRDFFGSLSRASSTKSEFVKIEVSESSLKVKAIKETGSVVFSQSMGAHTSWHDDGDRFIEVKVAVSVMRKLSRIISKNDDINFSVAFKPDGSPWAIIVYDEEDYNPKDPHNYFLLVASQ